MDVDEYWHNILFSLTEDELRFKATEIRELEKMDIVEFFSYYAIFEKQLEKRIDKVNKK